MSMSLRDQLLQAGLISQKQAKDAERQQDRQAQQQRQTQQRPKHRGAAAAAPARPAPSAATRSEVTRPGATRPDVTQPGPARPSPTPPDAARSAAAAKIMRDQALNRRQQEKAQKKALQAQIKQLIEQNRIPQAESDGTYNFVDGTKIRRIAASAAVRGSLIRGEIVIVRHQGQYDLVPAAIAARIRERDESAVIAPVVQESAATDEAYQAYAVPDDLIW